MKNSMALTLLRVCQSEKNHHAATPLMREFIDQFHIGRLGADGAHFSEADKERIMDLLMQHERLLIPGSSLLSIAHA